MNIRVKLKEVEHIGYAFRYSVHVNLRLFLETEAMYKGSQLHGVIGICKAICIEWVAI